MNYIVIICLIVIFIIYSLVYNRNNIFTNPNIIIYISSCNRFFYFNITVHSIVKHINIYEKLRYHIIIFDQGTIELRSYFPSHYHIYNYFFMNPNGYIYTYNIIFSYLYSKYVLLLDDDRPVRKDIENYILYKNFIELSMNIMDSKKQIFGFNFKKEKDGKVKCYNFSRIKYCKVEKAFLGYYYTNGASIYRSTSLKQIKQYTSERNVALYFGKTSLRTAYLYNHLKCKTISNLCNYFVDHIGKKSALNNKSICNVYIY